MSEVSTEQIDLSKKGLEVGDYYLLEVNSEDLETTSGEEPNY